eukprot:CAMPEP_0176060608 /NCGR_PEP_ID=MMETSP0120_2-20121206/30210_1 /TAXON_ID=160619 /ORGANISM="Kryptoperidinium foliaceum, Strain CCMP 1326" /LENGTH=533 /DNA_ID=CAMNT_0017394153 /DNA_START=1 /DNA_END=1602 /DNA_ORIENTATION=-
MFRWLAGDSSRARDSKAFRDVAEGLQKLYREKLAPVEAEHDFHRFYSPPLTDADFCARPMVLLLGQYSSGKSTFIRHILGRDYPGLRIGPEPTTDKFVAVCHGQQDQSIPGNAAVVDRSLPFSQLTSFGNAFLSRFECAKMPCAPLEAFTLIDTPGILSGEKQRVQRGYEFEAVAKWFADRVDMILLLFDVAKLDISDEFRRAILSIKGNDHKIFVVLNKADSCTTPQLMRVYGALMWNLGKVIDTPEVCRVYLGSFWDRPLVNDEQRRLFASEEGELFTTLSQLPRNAAVRKLSDLIRRARLARVHACIIDRLKKKMPYMFGHAQRQRELISKLPQLFEEIAEEKGLALGDFPDPKLMQDKLAAFKFSSFKKLSSKKMQALENMLSVDLPKLVEMIPVEAGRTKLAELSQLAGRASPFAGVSVDGQAEPVVGKRHWYRPPDIEKYREEFMAMSPDASGRVAGQVGKQNLIESKLPSTTLHRIWTLADTDRDGCLTMYEFALAKHLVAMRLDGHDLPDELPLAMAAPQYVEDG